MFQAQKYMIEALYFSLHTRYQNTATEKQQFWHQKKAIFKNFSARTSMFSKD